MAARHAALIERLQAQARQSPRLYLCKLALLALAGYGLLVGLLLVSLGVPAFVLAKVVFGGVPLEPRHAWVILLPGALGAALLRALWIRFAPPPGYRLTAGEAPLLEAEVERVRLAVGAPGLDGIVIDGNLNASALELPRAWGLLGHRHYLVLGFPLLQLMDRAELASVIAHEFGHFSERHGPLSGWIYRVRLSWYRVLEGLNGGGLVGYLLARFFAWYAPYFNAYSFVLARDNEYAADAAAARAAGAEALASALIRMELASRRLQCDPVGGIARRARLQGHPPAQMLSDIACRLQDPRPCNLQRLMELAARESDPDDTHPTLPQRLVAMGVAPTSPGRVGVPAIELLGARGAEIERQLDAYWREEVRPSWRETYAEAAADRARLSALELQATSTPDELLERARLLESLRDAGEALPLYEQVLVTRPGHGFAQYRCGLLRLREGDHEAGIEQLQRAMELDPGAVRPILLDLEQLARDPDLNAPTAQALAALYAHVLPLAQALRSRDDVEEGEQYQQHGLDDAGLAGLKRTFELAPRVAQAWLVRKRMDFSDDAAHFVILVDWRGSVVSEAAGLKQLAQAFELPGSFTVFTDTDAGHRDGARRVKQACRTPVYRRRDRRSGTQR